MKLLAAALLVWCSAASAAPPTFPQHMRQALECLGTLDVDHYRDLFRSTFNQPGKVDSGAFHFTVSETLYGQPVKELYVSVNNGAPYGSGRPLFVAAVFDVKREALQDALAQWPQLTFINGAQFGYSFNFTRAGTRIYELNGKAIMMCIAE